MKICGIDLGINKIAYAVWDDDILIETYAYESKLPTRGQVLADLAGVIFDVRNQHIPDYWFIEDTLIGNNRKYSIQLSQTMGAVLAMLGEYGEDLVYQVNVSTWKKEVIGNGRADKDAVRMWIQDRSGAYSELCGWDQDRFDAACIGYYGYRIAQRASVGIFG